MIKASFTYRRARGVALIFALIVFALLANGQSQRGLEPEEPQPGANGQLGDFYALVIGINDYHAPLPPLKSAVDDAKAVGKILEEHYGFKVQYLLDAQATRFNILDALGKYESSLQPPDNLLIYYAGHGYLDPNTKRAYWMPYDANSKLSPNRIISDDLMNEVSDAPARHVLVISDSCYSGDLANTRSLGASAEGGTPAVVLRMLARKSRNLMASGGEETVSDAGVDGHSVFAGVLLRALAENENSMYTASSLFYTSIKDSVVGNSTQTPEYAVIPNSTHNGGDFVFVRNGKAPPQVSDGRKSAARVAAPEPEPETEAANSAPSPGAGDFERSINQLRMSLPNISAALSSADVRFLKEATASGVSPTEIAQALRQKSSDGHATVAQDFFQNAANAPDALDWFGSALKAGLDPNMTVPNDYYGQEGLLIAAMRAGNAKAVKLLLENGASPHAYQDLFLTRFEDPRFLYPLQALAANDRFDLTEKQELAKAFIAAGVAIPDPAPMKPGARPIPIESAKEIQEETAKQLGVSLPVSPLCCQQSNPICLEASKRTHEDWCAIVAAFPKSLNAAFAPGGAGTPIWDIKLRYLLAIENNKAYFMGLRDLDNSFTTVNYVLVEVSKDGSSWTVLTYISPESGMGLCKRDDNDDTAPPAENCWRKVSLHRVAGTDEMRFDTYGLTWKIGK